MPGSNKKRKMIKILHNKYSNGQGATDFKELLLREEDGRLVKSSKKQKLWFLINLKLPLELIRLNTWLLELLP